MVLRRLEDKIDALDARLSFGGGSSGPERTGILDIDALEAEVKFDLPSKRLVRDQTVGRSSDKKTSFGAPELLSPRETVATTLDPAACSSPAIATPSNAAAGSTASADSTAAAVTAGSTAAAALEARVEGAGATESQAQPCKAAAEQTDAAAELPQSNWAKKSWANRIKLPALLARQSSKLRIDVEPSVSTTGSAVGENESSRRLRRGPSTENGPERQRQEEEEKEERQRLETQEMLEESLRIEVKEYTEPHQLDFTWMDKLTAGA
jgi:hypothetical protein